MRRRDFLISAGATAGLAAWTGIAQRPEAGGSLKATVQTNATLLAARRQFDLADPLPLRHYAERKGLRYGAAIQRNYLSRDPEFAACFARECHLLVPEGELKWRTLRPSLKQFNFAPADALLQFAQQNQMQMRGHTLVWHQSIPKWFATEVNSRNAEGILVNHIQTVMGHYAGKLHSWDVVNEPIHLKDNRADGLRNSPWLQWLGPDYIELAFRTAAATDPNTLLVLNEFGLDYDTWQWNRKREALLTLLQKLLSRGTPIHALGIQAHLWARDSVRFFNPDKMRAFLQSVAALGLKILITELDVADHQLPAQLEERDRLVASIYEDYLSVVLEEPAVIAVLTWGLSDRYTWLARYHPRADQLPVRPLPLDAQLQRKLAWNGIARSFSFAPSRSLAFTPLMKS